MRAVVVPSLARATRLYVTAKRGRRFAVIVEASRDGKVIAKAVSTGTCKSRPARIRARALAALR